MLIREKKYKSSQLSQKLYLQGQNNLSPEYWCNKIMLYFGKTGDETWVVMKKSWILIFHCKKPKDNVKNEKPEEHK